MRILIAEPGGAFREENIDDSQVNMEFRGSFSDLGRMILGHDIETVPFTYNSDVMPLDYFVVYYSKNPSLGVPYNEGVTQFLPLEGGIVFGSAIFLKLGRDDDGYCLDGLKKKEIHYFEKEIKKCLTGKRRKRES